MWVGFPGGLRTVCCNDFSTAPLTEAVDSRYPGILGPLLELLCCKAVPCFSFPQVRPFIIIRYLIHGKIQYCWQGLLLNVLVIKVFALIETVRIEFLVETNFAFEERIEKIDFVT